MKCINCIHCQEDHSLGGVFSLFSWMILHKMFLESLCLRARTPLNTQLRKVENCEDCWNVKGTCVYWRVQSMYLAQFVQPANSDKLDK